MKHERLSIEEWKRRFDNPKFCYVRHMADQNWDRVQNNGRRDTISEKQTATVIFVYGVHLRQPCADRTRGGAVANWAW